jgi:hypothetical protein
VLNEYWKGNPPKTKAFPNATDKTVALSVKDRELLNAASELGMFMQEIKDPRGVRWF